MRKALAVCLVYFFVFYVHPGHSMDSMQFYKGICMKLKSKEWQKPMQAATVPDNDDQEQILHVHNQARQNVAKQANKSPDSNKVDLPKDAANMLEMIWDDELADKARMQADTCLQTEAQCKKDMEVGQNVVLITSASSDSSSWLFAMQDWMMDANNYVYHQYTASRNTLSDATFNQMIWGTSGKIGCALKQLMGAGTNAKYQPRLHLCFYQAKGAVDGEYPYEQGQECSNCPAGTECSDGLCSVSDCKYPTQKKISPNPKKIVPPTPKVVPPTQKIVPPTPKVVPPTPKVVPPTPKVVPPIPKVVPPIPKVVPPIPKVVAPIPKVVPPTQKVVSPDNTVDLTNPSGTSNGKVVPDTKAPDSSNNGQFVDIDWGWSG